MTSPAGLDEALIAATKPTDSELGLVGVVASATDDRGTLHEGSAGVRSVETGEPMSPDTVLAIFSATKAITATAALQLVESGRLDLDAPAKAYAPGLAELVVLEGFDNETGEPLLRAPTRDVTTRMLLTHTAGFGYNFFNPDYLRMVTDHDQPTIISATHQALRTPLLFEPGEKWEYGSSMDWVGQVIEGITGQSLGEVLDEAIFKPLAMTSTGFTLTPAMRAKLASVYQRRRDGTLRETRSGLPENPEVHMAGHGLYSTAPDFTAFIRAWLNDGMGPQGPILKPETVAMAAQNQLGPLSVRALDSAVPSLTNPVDFFPGLAKSWGLGLMINETPAPTGRAKGTLFWAGLANTFFWIDRAGGIGGFWSTQLFPFFDHGAVNGFDTYETAVYRHFRPS